MRKEPMLLGSMHEFSGIWLRLAVASQKVALPLSCESVLKMTEAILDSTNTSLTTSLRECLEKNAWHDPILAAWLCEVSPSSEEKEKTYRTESLLMSRLESSLTQDKSEKTVDFIEWIEWKPISRSIVKPSIGVTGWKEFGSQTRARLEQRIDSALQAVGAPSSNSRRENGIQVSSSWSMIQKVFFTARELTKLQLHFEQAVADARMESMRELAYGAGHEINNPLANIAARAQSLLIGEVDGERRKRLATVVDQAFRARDMIGGLMLFARPPQPQPALFVVGDMVQAIVKAVSQMARTRGIQLDYSPAPVLIEMMADRSQIEESLRSIVVNAIEAVADGGRILVQVDRVKEEGSLSRVEIRVEDNGPGMDAATARRACDPFFSGREAGRGCGLGLSKAWRLIDSNKGQLIIQSHPREGTSVAMIFPMIDIQQEFRTNIV